MNKYRLLALFLILSWAFVVFTYITISSREHLTNIPPPTNEGLAGQLMVLSNRVDAAEEDIKSVQAEVLSAKGDVDRGKAAVAAAQGGLQSTLPGL